MTKASFPIRTAHKIKRATEQVLSDSPALVGQRGDTTGIQRRGFFAEITAQDAGTTNYSFKRLTFDGSAHLKDDDNPSGVIEFGFVAKEIDNSGTVPVGAKVWIVLLGDDGTNRRYIFRYHPDRFWAAITGSTPMEYTYDMEIADTVDSGDTYTYTATVDSTGYDKTATADGASTPTTIATALAAAIQAGAGDPWTAISATSSGDTVTVTVDNRDRAKADYITSTSSSSGGSITASQFNFAWLYDFAQRAQRDQSFVAGGAAAGTAINAYEYNATATTTGGGGAAGEDVDGNVITVLAIPTNAIVWIRASWDSTNSETVYGFDRPNEISVACA